MTHRPAHTSRRVYTHRDALGVEINRNDTLMVTAWGIARLIDTGTRTPVVRIGPKRIVIIDSEGQERAVNPRELSVLRRDGEPGYEGNKPRSCTCGARHFEGCFCNLTPKEFYAGR